MRLFVGLGNPGSRYARNRHNIGFMAANAIASRWRFSPERSRFSSLASEGQIETPAGQSVRALLLKPQTWMNESGRAVGAAMQFYKAKPSEVVAFYDEIDLAPGRFRMKTGGGAAGHNGIRSIISQVGPEFGRARLGVGHPGDKDMVHAYVLGDFAKADEPWVADLCGAIADNAALLARGEDASFQNRVHLAMEARGWTDKE